MTRALSLVVLLAMACGGQQKPGQQLMDDVRTFQEGLRWRRYEDAATRLPPRVRETFLDVREELDEELRIDDYEITRVRFKGDSAATVQVKITWHLDSVGIVHDTVVEQKWRKHRRSWFLVSEVRRRGEELPGLTGKLMARD